VVLEPSCASVFRDEMVNLLPKDERAKKLRAQTFLLSEFLAHRAPGYEPRRLAGRILVHGHCHHKALMKMNDELSLLQKMGAEVRSPDAGCCGMAGAFGFEKDKYQVSQAIGERVLLPAIRQESAATLIVADGFSCREQIKQATGRTAMHLAEVLQLAMKERRAP
jgi:Fe-S oxidoreductase